MTYEEQAIQTLPPAYQLRMAMLCLDGWHFDYSDKNEPMNWMAWKRAEREYMGVTLLTVLYKMKFAALPTPTTEEKANG